MTFYDAYIGRFDDPGFSWGDEEHEGSPPTRLSPFFPPGSRALGKQEGFPRGYPGRAFGEVVVAIEEGRFKGRKVDWGAWVAVATKEEIQAFVDELYVGAGDDSSTELKAYVASLRVGERYALVASEL